MAAMMELINLERSFKVGKEVVRAVDGVNLSVNDGEVVCVVGESGCGKTTTGKMAVGLLKPTGGEVRFRGKNIWQMDREEFRKYRQSVQIIHQDPYSSLNPTQTISDIMSAPLLRHNLARNRLEARNQASDLLKTVDLSPAEDFLDKYPHQLSGGQRQRVSIARALTVHPTFIMADEAVSMLDVSIRVSLLKMLTRFRSEMGMTYLFITHDLAVARFFAWDGRVAVMYLGRVVEIGPTPRLIGDPQHPYTKALLTAIPEADPEATRNKVRVALRSMDVPSLLHVPPGCPFHPRCPLFVPGLCDVEVPLLADVGYQTEVACHVVAAEHAGAKVAEPALSLTKG
jgi:oligopeptide/dipeptide ABC transporter ATP-binding protein